MKIEQIIKENIGVIDHNLPGYQHGDGLTKEGHPAHHAIRSDLRQMADDLREMYPWACKWLDIGSGAGYISERIREWDDTGRPPYTAVSLDGNLETRNLPTIHPDYHFIVRTDEPYRLVVDGWANMVFDVITCFEHFEHIHPDKFPQFIENIKKHMNRDTVLYASAAKWNYSPNDRVHVNVKPETLWKMEMRNYGFIELDTKLFNERNTANCKLRWSETAELAYKLI